MLKISFKKILIDKVEFNLECDKVKKCCITGGNGSGKTTLLRLLSGSFIPKNGIHQINNDIYDLSKNIDRKKLIKFSKKSIFYLEDNNIFLGDETTIYQNLKYFTLINNIRLNTVIDKFRNLYCLLNINEEENKKIKFLSMGTKQKLAIIFSLLLNPSILIIDEPLNFLDNESKDKLLNILNKENTNIVISSNQKIDFEKNNFIEVKVKKS
jgi:ABC-type multidrug transport system ATPase subunit